MKRLLNLDATAQKEALFPFETFYISPTPIMLDSIFYQVNRAGITPQTGENFYVNRDKSYALANLHCVIQGAVKVQTATGSFVAKAGQAFLLGPNEAHTYEACSGSPFGSVWMEFGGGDFHQVLRFILGNHGPLFEGETYREAIELCIKFLSAPKHSPAKTSIFVHDMLMAFAHTCHQTTQPTNNQIAQITAFIDSHLSDSLTLKQAAQHFGYSSTYFSTFFRQSIGITFSQYRLQKRVQRSCILLTDSKKTIAQIAMECGFYDISHFTQRFESLMGTSPAKYRLSLLPTSNKI